MNTEQDIYIDFLIPGTGDFQNEEVAKLIRSELYKSPRFDLGGDEHLTWVTFDTTDDEDDIDPQWKALYELFELSKIFPEVLFQVDTRSEFEDTRIFFLNGEEDEVEVTVTYGKTKWIQEKTSE